MGELAEWTSDRERAAMKIERDADDVARCFALERALYEGGWEQMFAGEVVGLISAGAFIAFGARRGGARASGECRARPTTGACCRSGACAARAASASGGS